MILPQPNIKAGDVLLGLPSSGAHSNGFSLIRKVVTLSGLSYSSPCPWDSQKQLGQALLEPTRIYIKSLLPALSKRLLKGLCHITGGGFIENIPRVLPEGLGCYIDASQWTIPPVFKFIMQHGGVKPLEMARTFNNGIGMVLVVAQADVEDAIRVLAESGEPTVYKIGEITVGKGVEMKGLDAWL